MMAKYNKWFAVCLKTSENVISVSTNLSIDEVASPQKVKMLWGNNSLNVQKTMLRLAEDNTVLSNQVYTVQLLGSEPTKASIMQKTFQSACLDLNLSKAACAE